MSSAYVLALFITLVAEVPIVAACFSGQRLRMAAVCAAATTCTHLSMHFILPQLVGSFGQFIFLGELGALLAEASVYWLASRPRDPGLALVASALANALSYGVGLLLI